MKAGVLPTLPALLAAALGFVAGTARGGAADAKAGVQVVRNVAYYGGPGADPVQHRLDIYLPRGRKDFPVVFFVHGGAWTRGDKNHFGIYAAVGRCFARHGLGMVSINYRLSPAVRHPEHIRDVARAFAWTHRHIARYGGRPDEVFLVGHSAGAHLVALLATDPRYIKAEGLTPADVRGVVAISGVYNLPPHPLVYRAFGKDAAVLRDASPLTHVRAGAPPFLILYSDHELPRCDGAQAEAFCKALCGKGCCAATFEVAHRNHFSILLQAMYDDDPVQRHARAFIAAQVTLHRLATGGPGGVDFLAGQLAP
jgi:acetyl esterase/lipase